MKKLLLAATAAGTVLVGGASVANAQWSLIYRWPTNAWVGDSAHAPYDCGFVTVREVHNGQVVLRRVPRC